MLKLTEARHHKNEATLELSHYLGVAYQNHVSA